MAKAMTVKQVWDEAAKELDEIPSGLERDLDPVIRIGFVLGVMKTLELLARRVQVDPRDSAAFLIAAHDEATARVKAVRAIRAARERTPTPSAN